MSKVMASIFCKLSYKVVFLHVVANIFNHFNKWVLPDMLKVIKNHESTNLKHELRYEVDKQ